MSINEVINVINGELNMSVFSQVLFFVSFALTVLAVIFFCVNDESVFGTGLLTIGFILLIFGLRYDSGINLSPDVAVKSYIKSLNENKLSLSDMQKGKMVVTGVTSKKGVDYVNVNIDGSSQKIGKFKMLAKVEYDVKDGDGAYITYKKLKKTLPGYYKKGWVNSTLHVKRGTVLMDIGKNVGNGHRSDDTVNKRSDRKCGESPKYVFMKEKGKLTITCVGKFFDDSKVFKGNKGDVLIYNSFNDAKEWLLKNIKEDKIDNNVLDKIDMDGNESFYK